MPESDALKFATVIQALGPWVDHVVIVGGWAHRLFRIHPLGRPVPYEALMTRDTDLALQAPRLPTDDNLRDRLISHGFQERYLGEDHPPVTHYELGGDDHGFYVEFLTPLVGSAFKRGHMPDATMTIAGVTAQKLRDLDILLIEPWLAEVPSGGSSVRIRVANPVAYVLQKLLSNDKRKPRKRAKDVLYIHDTIEVFAGSLPELLRLWMAGVRPRLRPNTNKRIQQARLRIFGDVTDVIRQAAGMATGRGLSPDGLLEVCVAGLKRVLG